MALKAGRADAKADAGKDGGEDTDGPSAEDVMSVQEMKPILAMAYEHDVSFALALTGKKEAVFLLHKKMPPKKLRTLLTSEVKDKGIELSTKVFCGHVKIDETNLVTITANKDLAGGKWERALRVPLRKAGYPNFVLQADAQAEV